jgi:lipopolysaccharide export system protein LptA
MRTRLVLFLCACGLFAAAPAQAQYISRQGGPIDITADSTEFVSSENVNRWVGKVHVKQGDAELKADRMDVYFTGSNTGTREIERIVADGSVIYNTPLQTARGDHGIYTASNEQILLTGRVRLIKGPDVFCGQEVVIQPRAGQAKAVGGTTDPMCPRVRGIISSSEAQQAKEQNKEQAANKKPGEAKPANGGAPR